MSRKQITYLLILVFLILLSVIFFRSDEDALCSLNATVQRGTFQSLVYSSGQLESEKSEHIYIPEKLKDHSLQIWELNITDLVEEGTFVDSGDYVATLDHKAVEEKISATIDELDQIYSEFQDSKIDSNLNLSNQRDAIVNARLDLEEKKLVVGESAYESPSIQKKAEMDLEKASRKLEQEQNAYELKKQQEENKVNRKFISYRQVKDRLAGLEELLGSLEIRSTMSGIITYFKQPWGEIIKTGSRVASWRPIIASVPDMTSLISRTYINEIDVSKVKIGQKATIKIDAFPEKELLGEVMAVANIGQLMPNSDAKVFEVKIKIFGEDMDLKPAMTTSNIIESGISLDTLFIPSETVFANDTMQYVYLNNDGELEKHVVWLGDENENYVIVRKGLNEGDEICFAEPEDSEEMEFSGLDIYEEILKEKERLLLEAEAKRDAISKSGNDSVPNNPQVNSTAK